VRGDERNLSFGVDAIQEGQGVVDRSLMCVTSTSTPLSTIASTAAMPRLHRPFAGCGKRHSYVLSLRKGKAGALVATLRKNRWATVTYATPCLANSPTFAWIFGTVSPTKNPPSTA